MNIRVTEDAANDLENIKAYIGHDDGVVAENTKKAFSEKACTAGTLSLCSGTQPLRI